MIVLTGQERLPRGWKSWAAVGSIALLAVYIGLYLELVEHTPSELVGPRPQPPARLTSTGYAVRYHGGLATKAFFTQATYIDRYVRPHLWEKRNWPRRVVGHDVERQNDE